MEFQPQIINNTNNNTYLKTLPGDSDMHWHSDPHEAHVFTDEAQFNAKLAAFGGTTAGFIGQNPPIR